MTRVQEPNGPGRPRVGISACLLGESVRYDGGHKRDALLVETLGRHVDWVPVCPEVECGLPVPREAMGLVGDPESPQLVTVETGVYHTDRMLPWTARRLDELADLDLRGFVFKSRSPSCAAGPSGWGLFARAFARRFPDVPVAEDESLHEPDELGAFVERILTPRP